MEGFVPFNAEKQLAEVTAGLKGGPFYAKPNLAPMMNFEMGYPPEVDKALNAKITTKGAPLDPWVCRRSNASMK